MNNKLARKFNLGRLIGFALPSTIMMICVASFSIVDNMFISRLVSTDALSASNMVFPLVSVVLAISIMLSTGGSAVIARKMGEGNLNGARQSFTFFVCVGAAISFVILAIGLLFTKPIVIALGATDKLIPYAMDYLKAMMLFTPFIFLQLMFQTFFVTAGHPTLGMVLIIIGGITNAVLDYIFMGVLNMGVAGAGIATGIGQSIPAIVGLLIFFNKKEVLHFVKPIAKFKDLLKASANGSSEMVSYLAMAVTTFIYNKTMLNFAGEDGVAAITVILAVQFLVSSLIMGFSLGISPVISYKFGNQDKAQLKKIIRLCLFLVTIISAIVFGITALSSKWLILIFADANSNVYQIALSGIVIFATNILFAGLNIFTSNMFTALSNGLVSAIISILRTFVLLVLCLLIFPKIFGINGVWTAVIVAEFLALTISIFFIAKNKKKYGY